MEPYLHLQLLKRTGRALSLKSIIQETVTPGMRVLDAGCGSGLLSVWAAQAGASAVLGVDRADLSLARRIASDNGVSDLVRFAQQDLARPDFHDEAPFDVVIAMVYLNDPRRDEQQAALVHGLKRYLRPGGTLIPDRVIYKGRACDWPSQGHDVRVAALRSEVDDLGARLGIRLDSFASELAERPAKEMFPARDADGRLDHVGARPLTPDLPFHVEDYHADPGRYPADLHMEFAATGTLNTLVWTQELRFGDRLIFSNESVTWVHPAVPVAAGERGRIALGERWRASNLASLHRA